MKSMNTFDCGEFQVQTLGDTISLTMFYILLYFITIIYKLFPSHKKVNRYIDVLSYLTTFMYLSKVTSLSSS